MQTCYVGLFAGQGHFLSTSMFANVEKTFLSCRDLI